MKSTSLSRLSRLGDGDGGGGDGGGDSGGGAGGLGAWYNNFSDLWGDITGAASHVTISSQPISNAAQRVANATVPGIAPQTVLYGALGLGALLLLTRRRNPPRGRRYR